MKQVAHAAAAPLYLLAFGKHPLPSRDTVSNPLSAEDTRQFRSALVVREHDVLWLLATAATLLVPRFRPFQRQSPMNRGDEREIP